MVGDDVSLLDAEVAPRVRACRVGRVEHLAELAPIGRVELRHLHGDSRDLAGTVGPPGRE